MQKDKRKIYKINIFKSTPVVMKNSKNDEK